MIARVLPGSASERGRRNAVITPINAQMSSRGRAMSTRTSLGRGDCTGMSAMRVSYPGKRPSELHGEVQGKAVIGAALRW